MKIQVLEEATVDLADGFRFYERQSEGLGDVIVQTPPSLEQDNSAKLRYCTPVTT